MDPSALHRLREWLERREIAALDPRRIEALALSLAEPDPPVRVERWGTVVGYEAGTPRRRLVQFDRHGHLIAACRWSPEGALDWARCRAADGRWIGVEPGAIEHPAWGRSDRVWLLDGEETWGEEPWRPVEPLTVFRSLDWAALDHIPPLAEPRRLPPGAGSAVLNLVASLMRDQGVARVRYRGPFPSEQLFTTLLECFRYDPGQALPLERFLADGGLDWLPAPYESHRVAAWATVQLRQNVDKVVADRVTFYRPEWQGIARREARVIRDDGERVVCSLWALGGPLEDRLVLDRSGEILEAPAARALEAPPASPSPGVELGAGRPDRARERPGAGVRHQAGAERHAARVGRGAGRPRAGMGEAHQAERAAPRSRRRLAGGRRARAGARGAGAPLRARGGAAPGARGPRPRPGPAGIAAGGGAGAAPGRG
jgi:hypothetical protein